MKTRLLKLVHSASLLLTVLVMGVVFLLALIRAEAPVVASEMPTVTRFLSSVFGRPVQIESMQLRWRHLLPVFDLHNVSVLGDSPFQISEVKLGLHFILLKNFHINVSTSSPPAMDSSGYFNHVILEDAVITVNQFQFKLGRLDLHKKSGNFWAWKGNGISLDFGKVFLAPLLVNTSSGQVQINSQADQWQIHARNISISNKDVVVLAKADFTGTQDSSPVVDIAAHYEINPNTVDDLKNYLPQTKLKPDVKNWLTESIKSIQSGEGSFILKGALSDFPFDKKPGQFLIDANVIGGALNYLKGWPDVTDIDAELIFSNNKMLAHVHSAETAHTAVQNIDVGIPDLKDKSVLEISGNISTDVENSLYFIRHSPLQNTLGKRFAGLQWTGPMTLGLQLNIPLQKKSAPKINGSINLKNTELNFSAWKIQLKNLSGLLSFTQDGFSSPKLTASFSNAPVTMSIDKKNIYHIQYKKYTADIAALQNGGWKAKVDNAPAWRGVFTISSNPMQTGITGVMYYFNVDANDVSSLPQDFKPSTLPPLNIQIQRIRYKTLRVDAISLQTRPLANGLFVRYLQINGPGYSIVGQGKWLDTHQSILDGKLESNDIAKMIASWGLDPSIQGNAGEADFHLSWPGMIYSPDLKHLSGNMDVYVGKGQLKTSGSQAKMDFGRLLTLLSFQSIQRRLSLDFSDITQKGLGFDSISGFILLNNNPRASIKKLTLKSAVARVDLMGDIDLIQKRYNLNVIVTPHLTSSLPIVATLAGGPVAGAAVWAASKVVNPILNKVTEDKYSVTGPWNNPVIKKE